MTDKELQKLGRRELLELLLEQAKEAERLGKLLRETDEQLRQLEESYERLRERLDHKDEKIHELQDALQAEQEKAPAAPPDIGSLAEAALQLSGVFEAAQQAADQYLESIRMYYPLPESARPAPEPLAQQAEAQPQPQFQAQPQFQSQFQPQPQFQSAVPQPPPPVPEPSQEKPPAQPQNNGGKRPFGLRRKQEKGKTTLFFGWQHD